MSRTVVCVVGTRPEVVKMAPVVLRLRGRGGDSGLRCRVLATAQHRGLLDRALADFGLEADRDLDLMRPEQGLSELTARALVALADALRDERPDLVLAQGDTTTVLATALACHYEQIPFAHVEAGLRTGRPYHPFPEEKNRVLATHLATLHFAPTARARANLLREGIASSAIRLTGNTVIDALRMIAERPIPLPCPPPAERFLLVTAHRRENWGGPMDEICGGLLDALDRHADLGVIFPVHPNPRLRNQVAARLGGHGRIRLIEPVGYPEFVALMKASFLILTDSGGVQEEAPSLGKPVLVLRDETERPEAVEAGTVALIGPRRGAIASAVADLHDRPESYARVANPYGDGRAAERIEHAVRARLGLDPGPTPPASSP